MPANTDELVDMEILEEEIQILKKQIRKFELEVAKAKPLAKRGKILLPRCLSWEMGRERLASVVQAFSKHTKQLRAKKAAK